MKRLLTLSFAIFCCLSAAWAQPNQDLALAQQFFSNAEYDKALVLFEELYEEDPGNYSYYRYLYSCMLNLEQFEDLEKLVKKNSKKDKGALHYLADLGFIYITQGDRPGGEKEYEDAIKQLSDDENQIRMLANAFNTYREYAYVVETYEKGKKLLGKKVFTLELAMAYEKNDQVEKALEFYLDYILEQPKQTQFVKNTIQRSIQQNEYYEALKGQLLQRIQQYPNEIVYPEMLIWLFVQKKEFAAALIQAKALDKRFNEDGFRVLELARSAAREGKYNASIDAYEYVMSKGITNPLYIIASREILKTRQEKITSTTEYTQEDLLELDAQYEQFITEFGLKPNTYQTLQDRAHLKAFFLHDIESAIALLEEATGLAYADKKFVGECKLDLGDFYLIKGEVWEASLIYGQVDKSFKDEPLGEAARFRNARLSYFKSEFEWAQAQLNILKSATSELVANDAIALSVFITDNLGLDTSSSAMKMYAQAELLAFQNKNQEALDELDDILDFFPSHALSDDIYFKKAGIYRELRDYDMVIENLENIRSEYADELLGDDALYQLAELYDYILKDEQKAMELYEELLLNYQDSVYVVEARKRFRILRGDEL